MTIDSVMEFGIGMALLMILGFIFRPEKQAIPVKIRKEDPRRR